MYKIAFCFWIRKLWRTVTLCQNMKSTHKAGWLSAQKKVSETFEKIGGFSCRISRPAAMSWFIRGRHTLSTMCPVFSSSRKGTIQCLKLWVSCCGKWQFAASMRCHLCEIPLSIWDNLPRFSFREQNKLLSSKPLMNTGNSKYHLKGFTACLK